MPTYEYKCRDCGHMLEIFQSMNDSALTTCPECGEESLKRLIGTGAGIIFKGSGFYETDYRSESYQKSAKKDVDSTSKPAGGGAESKKSTSSTKSTRD